MGCVRSKHSISSADKAKVRSFITMVRPLDLIVFKGADFVSNTIRKLEAGQTGCGDISHVEVAISPMWCSKISPIIRANPDTLFSWGSTLSGPLNDGALNAETHHTTFGVQIRLLEDVITAYLANPNANVGICRLLDNPTDRRADESAFAYSIRAESLKNKIASAYDLYNGRGYDANPLALFGAMFPSLRKFRETAEDHIGDASEWLFCSEFVAAVYVQCGIITDETDGKKDGKIPDPKNVLPVDFLGCDADTDGLVNPICQIPPVWIK